MLVAETMMIGREATGYTVLVGDLARRLELKPMDLVRICGVAVGTAHLAYNNKHIKLETIFKIYEGLKRAGYEVRWDDVVRID